MTLAFGAAPIAVAMANHPELEKYDLSSLRYMMWAATPIAEDVANRVTERSGIRWLHAYGATEVPGLHCNPVDYPERWRLDTPGLPVSDLEVRVVDLETHEDVATRDRGRDHRARPPHDGGIPAGRSRRRRLPRRLGAHRRRRVGRTRGMDPHHGPGQGDDQSVRLLGRAGRDRGHVARSSRGRGLWGVRRAARHEGRGAQGGDRAHRARRRVRRRPAHVRRREARRLQARGGRRVRRRDPAHGVRQGPAAQPQGQPTRPSGPRNERASDRHLPPPVGERGRPRGRRRRGCTHHGGTGGPRRAGRRARRRAPRRVRHARPSPARRRQRCRTDRGVGARGDDHSGRAGRRWTGGARRAARGRRRHPGDRRRHGTG